MGSVAFCYPTWRGVGPAIWVDLWARLYDDSDELVYFELMKKHVSQGTLLCGDIELVGRWKEGCLKADHGGWKPRTPRAFEIWMRADAKPPQCPKSSDEIIAFLNIWAKQRFLAANKDDRMKSFGLSRATTLLHFISGGRFPILDSNVANAMKLLGMPIDETSESYVTEFCRLFSELANDCGVSGLRGLRKLDNALFSYGSDLRLSYFKLGPCPGAQI
jgi:hypothetical protein